MSNMQFGISTCGALESRDASFRDFANAGASCVEISEKQTWMQQADWAGLAQEAERAGVILWTVHLPFVDLDISDPNEALRKNAVETQKNLIQKAAMCGAKIAILHPSGEPITDEARAGRIALAKNSLAELAAFAAEYGITIAVEDLPRTCLGRTSEDMLQLLSADDRLRICFDTNHLLLEDNVHFVAQLRDRIVTTHVSDYDFINERHILPGEGKVNWKALVDALDAIDYSGPLMYEVDLNGSSSVKRGKSLAYSDLYRNYETLVKRETPWIPAEADRAVIVK